MTTFPMILALMISPQGQQQDNLCINHPQQLFDKSGKPVRLSLQETKKRIIHCELPKIPGNLDVQGVFLVQILINPAGEVECARWLTGPDFVGEIAVESVKKWRFKPIGADGKAVAVYGLVKIHIGWRAEVKKKTCQP